MSRFYMTSKNSNSLRTLRGFAKGSEIILNGWNSGIRVTALETKDKTIFKIYKTSGSNNIEPEKLIKTIKT